jgi:hypothetical protein
VESTHQDFFEFWPHASAHASGRKENEPEVTARFWLISRNFLKSQKIF